MRNVFDQYTQPENRLTHALLCSLDADRQLLADFVRWVTGTTRTEHELVVCEQSFPDDVEIAQADDGEKRGLPDGCVAADSGWALLIESKLGSQWNPDQLQRHRRTAEKHGLSDVTILCLTVGRSSQAVPDGCVARAWDEVYEWLASHVRSSEWARRCSRYFDVAEGQLIANNGLPSGAITMFTGIPFCRDEPYTYVQAKRLLTLLKAKLLEDDDMCRVLDVDPGNEGRGAITGTKGRLVWDYLGFKAASGAKSFTEFPHLTLGILDDRLEAMFTVPNGAPPGRRRAMLGATHEEFERRIAETVRAMESALEDAPGARPVIAVVQRHYPYQRAEPIVDADLRFDPRTAVEAKTAHGVRRQAEWLKVAFDVIDNRNSNVQFQIGAEFPYATCPAVASSEIARSVSRVWQACRPLVLDLKSA